MNDIKEDAEALHLNLDNLNIPRTKADGRVLSLWGRVLLYAEKAPLWWVPYHEERKRAYGSLKPCRRCGSAAAIYMNGGTGEVLGERVTFSVSCRGLGCKNAASECNFEVYETALETVEKWNESEGS